mmetsp:Transcript_81143/g.262931  ORF Transcript_81143/g.262931 Transcript_81143/m.262931 type:complete len:204 (+) Transcript_81143:446-1057(+)
MCRACLSILSTRLLVFWTSLAMRLTCGLPCLHFSLLQMLQHSSLLLARVPAGNQAHQCGTCIAVRGVRLLQVSPRLLCLLLGQRHGGLARGPSLLPPRELLGLPHDGVEILAIGFGKISGCHRVRGPREALEGIIGTARRPVAHVDAAGGELLVVAPARGGVAQHGPGLGHPLESHLGIGMLILVGVHPHRGLQVALSELGCG